MIDICRTVHCCCFPLDVRPLCEDQNVPVKQYSWVKRNYELRYYLILVQRDFTVLH